VAVADIQQDMVWVVVAERVVCYVVHLLVVPDLTQLLLALEVLEVLVLVKALQDLLVLLFGVLLL
jgi:hypothetical protein